LKFQEEGEEVEEEETLGVEVITEEEEILEVEEEGSAAGEVGEIIDLVVVAAEVVEIEENIGVEVVDEENIEGVGEEGHPAEVVVVSEKGRDHPMVEETDTRAEDLHLHLPIVERETTIERREEDLPQGMDHHQGMDHQEDHLLPGIVMVHHAEIMGDLPLQGPPEDPMREAGQAVAVDMKRAIPAGGLHHHLEQTGSGAEVQWLVGTLLPMKEQLGLGILKNS